MDDKAVDKILDTLYYHAQDEDNINATGGAMNGKKAIDIAKKKLLAALDGAIGENKSTRNIDKLTSPMSWEARTAENRTKYKVRQNIHQLFGEEGK